MERIGQVGTPEIWVADAASARTLAAKSISRTKKPVATFRDEEVTCVRR
ncbi:hypothetical protein I545_1564 [Mycobacterium kansasii 662]|uniref:Uncharacterized protein n=2 Tax=Mycobacterium kansasii TaxID=1768 RepID=A0A1V3WD71_MYCKA|nr:hypothetical protein I547_4998 [Mycobacterium kansasii 824]EUA20759.1 hypothetical protein I545_1564 [Mycobacterium kansasii 662]OOK64933.1 hypothetical protein BZL30_8967 [Mycobacterium kansasii]OOK66003.1 hypothetical protein BZL29_7383 [Mycobacterium kansasii]